MLLSTAVKQRSAYLMRTRREEPFERFTPDDYVNKGKEPQIPEKRRRKLTVRRMRHVSSSDEDEENEEETQPEVRVKTMPTRGRATTSHRTRGRK